MRQAKKPSCTHTEKLKAKALVHEAGEKLQEAEAELEKATLRNRAWNFFWKIMRSSCCRYADMRKQLLEKYQHPKFSMESAWTSLSKQPNSYNPTTLMKHE